MANKQIIKEVFASKFDSNKIKEQILLEYEKKGEKKKLKMLKYAIAPICLIVLAFMGFTLNKDEGILEKPSMEIMKVYAYTTDEESQMQRTELKDNIKLGLAKYNMAMSSAPGYPIEFELENLEYIEIKVTNGTIFDCDRETGKVTSIGSKYDLQDNKVLYFRVNENTNISIKGINNQKEVFEKNIIIESDDKFNYYATIK